MLRSVLALVLLACLMSAAPAHADVVDDRVAAVSRGPGDLLIFARGDDGKLHMRSGIDGTWASLGVAVSSGPTAAVRGDGTVEVVARAPDRTLTYASLKGSTWSAWGSLPGTVLSAPSLTARQGTDAMDLFVRGDDDGLYQFSFTPASGWGPAQGLGGPIFSAPSALSRRPGILDVYVHGVEQGLFVKGYDGRSWTPFFRVEGNRTNAVPSATLLPDGNHLVLFRELDGGLHERRFLEGSGAYAPASRLDASRISSGPSAVVTGDQQNLVVFARDGGNVLTRNFSPTGLEPWRSLGPVAAPASAPQPPAPAPAPVGGGQVSFEAGLSCTPRGGKVPVGVTVRKRQGRSKPRVTRVVFFYKRGKRGRVVRTDRKAPYRRNLPVALKPGTYRVYARIEYKRGRKSGRKTVSRRFAVCG